MDDKVKRKEKNVCQTDNTEQLEEYINNKEDFINNEEEYIDNKEECFENQEETDSNKTTLEDNEDDNSADDEEIIKAYIAKRKKRKKICLISGGILVALFAAVVILIFTRPGRKVLYNIGSEIITSRVDTVEAQQNDEVELFSEPTPVVIQPEEPEPIVSDLRREEYVANFLIMGIEEIDGGARSDSMMIASVNIKDNTIKLTSVMRDCYVEIEGHGHNKLNAAYSFGGSDLLIDTIERNFKIDIDGFASVNFKSFESIIDKLDGVDIELGKTEANYLNTENYISKPENRNVTAGWNHLNGNQALGYARVRHVATLGGVTDDYGRTLRQRRLLNAIFDKYKSKSALDLLTIAYDILPEIKTNLTSTQISDLIEQIVENSITTIDNYRIPAKGCFQNVENECGDVLVLDFDANIEYLYQNVFLDEVPLETEDEKLVSE